MNEVWLLWFWFLAENSLKGCVITDLKLPFWDITERLLSLLGAAVRCWLLSQNVNKKNFMKFQTLWNFKFLETRENISSLSKCRIGIGRRRICGTLRHKIKEWILTQVIPFQFNAIFWQLTQNMTRDCSLNYVLTCSIHAILHLIVLNTPRNSKQFLVKFEVHIVNVNLYFGLIDE